MPNVSLKYFDIAELLYNSLEAMVTGVVTKDIYSKYELKILSVSNR